MLFFPSQRSYRLVHEVRSHMHSTPEHTDYGEQTSTDVVESEP